jgi:hypothetical protein
MSKNIKTKEDFEELENRLSQIKKSFINETASVAHEINEKVKTTVSKT